MNDEPNAPERGRLIAHPRRLLRCILPLAAVLGVVSGAAAAWTTSQQDKSYTAAVTFVSRAKGVGETDILARNVEALLKSEELAAAIADDTGSTLTPRQIAASITTSRPPGSGVVTAKVTTPNLARSTELASAIDPALRERLQELLLTGGAEESSDVVVGWTGTPVVSTNAPPVARNSVLGVGLGLALAMIAAALWLRARPVLESVDDLAALDVSVVAVLPKFNTRGQVAMNPGDTIRGVLTSAFPAGRRMQSPLVLVTSPDRDPSSARVALAASDAFASSGLSVLLIDADVDTRRLSSSLGLDGKPGLLEHLHDGRPLEEVAARALTLPPWLGGGRPPRNMKVVPVGQGPNGVATARSLLGSLRVDNLVEPRPADVVVVAGPRVPGPSPAWALLELAGLVLVVATEGATSMRAAATACELLKSLASCPVEAVLLGAKHVQFVQTNSSRGGAITPTLPAG